MADSSSLEIHATAYVQHRAPHLDAEGVASKSAALLAGNCLRFGPDGRIFVPDDRAVQAATILPDVVDLAAMRPGYARADVRAVQFRARLGQAPPPAIAAPHLAALRAELAAMPAPRPHERDSVRYQRSARRAEILTTLMAAGESPEPPRAA